MEKALNPYEEDLPELLEKVVSEGSLEATTDTETAVRESDITFLAVGTPMKEDGSINLDYIKQAAEDAAEGIKDKEGFHVFVVKSTVVPTTTEEEIIPILEEVSAKKAGEEFGVCMNPEFLREGTALNDFLEPDRIVIGELDERSGDVLEKVYCDFDAPIMRTSLKAAELIKYASNSLLATKISFINEIGNLCKELGIDVYEVADGVGMDSRLKRDFLNSGPGWGGSCFPKDVRALIKFMGDKEVDTDVLQSAVKQNQKQKTRLVEILEDRTDIEGKTVAVLGLSFKPGTDDIRNSPAIDIISELKEKGAKVKAYDPEAMDNMEEKYPDIEYSESAASALQGADAGLIVTHWEEFNDITMEEIRKMKNPVIIEGRKMEYEILEEHREGITWP
ncbi:nucleotide sugar dehydrogenase [Nanohaloarchaea archaeon H01]|nr:nucleotide sugar dehydrogenase [Nanohaloarchaea archaeon H01]